MRIPDLAQATIDRLLRSLSDEERAGAAPAGFRTDAPDLTIDDGDYGDPARNTRPEWMRERERGWTLFGRF